MKRKGKKGAVIRTILSPTDFSACSDEAQAYAAMIGRVFEARVLLVHVIESYTYSMTETFNLVDHYTALKTVAERMLDNARRRLQQQGVSVEAVLMTGAPHREILKKSRQAGADMIVMGTHGRTGLEHFLLGSVAEKVVRLSSCPVLTVRSGAENGSVKKKKTSAANRKPAVTLYS